MHNKVKLFGTIRREFTIANGEVIDLGSDDDSNDGDNAHSIIRKLLFMPAGRGRLHAVW